MRVVLRCCHTVYIANREKVEIVQFTKYHKVMTDIALMMGAHRQEENDEITLDLYHYEDPEQCYTMKKSDLRDMIEHTLKTMLVPSAFVENSVTMDAHGEPQFSDWVHNETSQDTPDVRNTVTWLHVDEKTTEDYICDTMIDSACASEEYFENTSVERNYGITVICKFIDED